MNFTEDTRPECCVIIINVTCIFIIPYCKNSAILFYTRFPSYEALISFLKYIRPKIRKDAVLEGRAPCERESTLPRG